jgi:hypothetical protein
MVVTTRQVWVGFLILFVVTLLVLVTALYWNHIIGVDPLHLLALGPDDYVHGC